jgi:hypothetical protein
LERWIVDNPDLVGEQLLVLGHQLAEFAEDRDRLDILALDRSGEIVLVELKVSDDFRVTDLQALASEPHPTESGDRLDPLPINDGAAELPAAFQSAPELRSGGSISGGRARFWREARRSSTTG